MNAKKKSSMRKQVARKKAARKKPTPAKAGKRPKKMAKEKPARKKSVEKTKVAATKRPRKKSQPVGEVAFRSEGRGLHSGEQAGDLQGLSHLETADSESVDELIEEGNAFEADVVAGVESADDADEKEVRTHEVPEDDVPEEYLDKE
jgi:hypothetical protein